MDLVYVKNTIIMRRLVFQLHGTEGTTREDIYTQGVSGKNAHIQRKCGPELTDYLFNVTKKDQVDHVNIFMLQRVMC